MKSFKDKILLITGGTGSFGNAVIRRFLQHDFKEIRIFSRDEKKQDDMRKQFNHPQLSFYIGDVRNKQSISNAMQYVDYCFHAAALKQVPSCEFFPMEAVLTNVIGTQNVLESARENKVKKVICLSTDKAVYPVNAMGMSKAIMEKIVISQSRLNNNHDTKFCITRYGNVIGSRGSVIPLFIEQIKSNKPLTITEPNMTRFLMTLDDAVDLVMYAFDNGDNGDIFVQKSPASTILKVSSAIKKIFNNSNYPEKIIGTRHGEKLYESLLSAEEKINSVDKGNFFQVKADVRDLNYQNYVSSGKADASKNLIDGDYNSSNTIQLEVDEIIELLKKSSDLSLP